MFDKSFLSQRRFQVDPAVFASALNDCGSNNISDGNNNDNNNNNNYTNTTTTSSTTTTSDSKNNGTLRTIDFGFHNGNELPHNFVPYPMDVIAGRGKACFNHPGNKRFRQIIDKKIVRYSCAKTKMDKSLIVNDIVDEIRAMSPSGGFVKQFSKGRWRVLDDATSREKVGHAIRDALSMAENKKKQAFKRSTDSQSSSSEEFTESDEKSLEMFRRKKNVNKSGAPSPNETTEDLLDTLFQAQKIISKEFWKFC